MNEAHPVRLGQSLGQGKRPLHGLLPGREPEPRPGPGGGRKDLDRQKRSIRIEAEVENAARRGVRQQRGQAEAPGDLPFQVRRLEAGHRAPRGGPRRPTGRRWPGSSRHRAPH